MALTDAEIEEQLERLDRRLEVAADYDDDGEDEEPGEELALTDRLDDQSRKLCPLGSPWMLMASAPPSFLDQKPRAGTTIRSWWGTVGRCMSAPASRLGLSFSGTIRTIR